MVVGLVTIIVLYAIYKTRRYRTEIKRALEEKKEEKKFAGDEEDEKNEGKTMRVTTTQLRQIVRESLIQTLMVEQDVKSANETLNGTLDE